MEDPFRRPSLIAAVFYKDPWSALDWLEKAFGFERSMVITDKDGRLGHSEMRFGDSLVGVGSEWADFVASPESVGNKNTQMIHVHLPDGIDAHCARAAAAGATIVQEPTDQFMVIALTGRATRRAMFGLSGKRCAASRARTQNGQADSRSRDGTEARCRS